MAKLMVLVGFCLVGFGAGMPASNEQLDKKHRKGEHMKITKTGRRFFKENLDSYNYNLDATVNDVAINAVSEEKKPAEVPQQPSTVEISGISTGVNPAPANPVAPQDNGGFKPQRATSMFARIIDDIFQIPITVLQNVARLITNPFSQARKEVAPVAS